MDPVFVRSERLLNCVFITDIYSLSNSNQQADLDGYNYRIRPALRWSPLPHFKSSFFSHLIIIERGKIFEPPTAPPPWSLWDDKDLITQWILFFDNQVWCDVVSSAKFGLHTEGW